MLESRLEKTSNLLKKTQEESENKAILVEMQNLHQAELEHINKSLEEMRQQHLDEVCDKKNLSLFNILYYVLRWKV